MIKIKVGVIGAGRWGQKHINEYCQLKDVELSWVSDLSKDAILKAKKENKISNISTDYKDVLNSDVKAVSICTSNQTHYEVCKAALNAGKHALVEKPLTLEPKEANELVKLAEEKNLTLAVGHLYRYNNAINEVKKLIDKKYFGKINYLRLQWTIQWSLELYPDKKLDIIVDMMPHLYDIMNYITGLWPKKVTCFAKNFIKPEFEDTAYIYCEFPNNIMTHSEISWTLPEKVRQVDVIGSKATAKIQAVDQKVTLFEKSNDGKALEIKQNNTLGDELAGFIDAVKKNKKLSNSGKIGAKTVELVEATRKSLDSGNTISL